MAANWGHHLLSHKKNVVKTILCENASRTYVRPGA